MQKRALKFPEKMFENFQTFTTFHNSAEFSLDPDNRNPIEDNRISASYSLNKHRPLQNFPSPKII